MTVLDSASLHKFLLHFTDTLTPELAEHFVKLPADPGLGCFDVVCTSASGHREVK